MSSGKYTLKRDTTRHLLEGPKSGALTTPNAGGDVESRELSFIAGRSAPWKTVWKFLTELNILLPDDPVIMLLDIYPKELKTYVQIKTYTWMFRTALFIVAKTWKQPTCPSVSK